MKVVAIIQARMSSSRLPGKVLMPLSNKPVLEHVVERLSYCKLIEKIVVATSTNIEDNQIFDYCQVHNLDYHSVADIVGADDRIGHSHTQITDERGFGGHCFPKDVKALITSAKAYGCSLSLLEEASNYNNRVRKDQV